MGDLVASSPPATHEDEWHLDELIQALRGVASHVSADLTPERWQQNMKRDQIEADAIEIARHMPPRKSNSASQIMHQRRETQIMLWAVDTRWSAPSHRPGPPA